MRNTRMKKKWSRFKRCLHRIFHPNAHLYAAMRLGRMQVNQEAYQQLPPIFGEKPVLVPVNSWALPDEDRTLWAAPQLPLQPVVQYEEVQADLRAAYHLRLEERRRISQHSTSMIRKTILLSAADEPPLEGEPTHEIPAWLK